MLVPLLRIDGIYYIEYFKAQFAMDAVLKLQSHPHFCIFFFKSIIDFVDFINSLRQLKVFFLCLLELLIKFIEFRFQSIC